jgi:hypothetical protein
MPRLSTQVVLLFNATRRWVELKSNFLHIFQGSAKKLLPDMPQFFNISKFCFSNNFLTRPCPGRFKADIGKIILKVLVDHEGHIRTFVLPLLVATKIIINVAIFGAYH